jgi:hypothetical protein
MSNSMLIFDACRSASITNADAPLQVNASGDRLQMGRIHAATDTAQVVKIKSFRDRAFDEHVSDSMSQSVNRSVAIANCEPCVTLLVNPSKPQPTTAIRLWQNLREQALQHVTLWSRHCSSLHRNLGLCMSLQSWYGGAA